jgi:hypothetical protein
MWRKDGSKGKIRQSRYVQVCVLPWLYKKLIVISVRHSLLITGRVCGHPCSYLGKLCSKKCAVFTACYSARSGVRRSLPDLWQSDGVQYIPAGVSKYNQYISSGCAALSARRGARASVRISLLVLVEVRLCQCTGDSALVVVHLVLWKCDCDSALVRYQRILYRRSTWLSLRSVHFAASQGYPILTRVRACGGSHAVTFLARYHLGWYFHQQTKKNCSFTIISLYQTKISNWLGNEIHILWGTSLIVHTIILKQTLRVCLVFL